MNSQLMEILNVIQEGLRGEGKGYNYLSSADNICSTVISVTVCGANTDGELCNHCPVGYNNSKGYATQIIQVFKNI